MVLRKLRASLPAPAFPRVLFSRGHKTGLSTTAWIDGVRGLAALIVTLNHMLFVEIDTSIHGYHGYHAAPAADNTSLLQLPPLRLLFAMHAMVPLFFVISGYCLSLSSIRRRHDPSALLATLSSAVFRRATRLLLPLLAITLVSQALLYLGAYSWGWWDNAWALSLADPSTPSPAREHLAFLLDYLDGVADAILTGLSATAPPGLNPQLWTIPAEFRGSLVVYLCLLGTALLRSGPRAGVLVGTGGLFLVRGTWDLAAFVGGLVVAELELARRRCAKGGIIGEERAETGTRVGAVALWVVGVYLLCTPAAKEEEAFSPLYAVLGPLTPGTWIRAGGMDIALACWRSVGGVAFVGALSMARGLRRPFEVPAVQYFGKISFMLYLVHQLVIRTLMRRLRVVVEVFVSFRREGLVTFFTASGTLVVMFWVSEILVEVLDKRSVTLAKRLLEKWSAR